MPTWPNSTKASTTNLDAGTDRPSLARADIKQNVDNVNDIIDTLFIPSTPANNQILKYVSANSRFELSSDIGITSVSQDTSPVLGGNLTVTGYKLITASNGNIELEPNGTGDVYLTADTVRVGDSNANATITTNGTGDLILNTNAGSSSGSITIEDAANGDITLAPNGTGRVEIPGTTSQSGGIRLFEELTSAGNTNSVVLRAPQVIQNDITLTLPSTVTSGTLGYLNVPAVGTKTGSYTLTTQDVGEYVQVGSGGSITIPNSTFAEGDVIVIVNNHSAAITITCSITDAYIAGTDTDKATVSLATRGVASLFFLSATRVIISGNVS